jgi:hypothetical protein
MTGCGGRCTVNQVPHPAVKGLNPLGSYVNSLCRGVSRIPDNLSHAKHLLAMESIRWRMTSGGGSLTLD